MSKWDSAHFLSLKVNKANKAKICGMEEDCPRILVNQGPLISEVFLSEYRGECSYGWSTQALNSRQ